MAADGRLPVSKLSAAGFAPGQVPVATGGGGFKPGSAGGLLGYQYATLGYPNISANGSTVTATSDVVSTFTGQTGGTPGISGSGSGAITFCTDSVSSYYLINARVTWTGATGGAATDVFFVAWNDYITRFEGYGVGVAIASTLTGVSFTESGPDAGSSVVSTPELRVLCPNGAGRTLTGVGLQYEVLRFAV